MSLRLAHIRLIIVLSLLFMLFVGYKEYMYNRASAIVPLANVSNYNVYGIDISAHNGEIDFATAKADNLDFVLIKASEGATFRDAKFNDNYENASKAGFKVGAYHFFRYDVTGRQQAENFLDAVKGKDLSLPLAIDVENSGNPWVFFKSPASRELRNMIDHLKARHYPVIVYTNKSTHKDLISGRFHDCPLWLCTFSKPDTTYQWTIWQYSHVGQISGIPGDVDLNVFCGDSSEWDTFVSRTRYEFSEAAKIRQ